MLCLSGFELYSRWVPLYTVYVSLKTLWVDKSRGVKAGNKAPFLWAKHFR